MKLLMLLCLFKFEIRLVPGILLNSKVTIYVGQFLCWEQHPGSAMGNIKHNSQANNTHLAQPS